jgi:hypothetical protein
MDNNETEIFFLMEEYRNQNAFCFLGDVPDTNKAEKLTIDGKKADCLGNAVRNDSYKVFSRTRFGNLIGSRVSVAPLLVGFRGKGGRESIHKKLVYTRWFWI